MRHVQINPADYAGIKVDKNAAATVIPLVNSWKLIEIFDTNSPARASTPDQANNQIIVAGSGTYEIGFNGDTSSAGVGKVYEVNCFEISAEEKVITGATAADPVVVTSVGHLLSDGNKGLITGVVGMVELNSRIFTLQDKAADTFELTDDGGASPANDIDGSGFTPYVSDGIIRLATELDVHSHRKYASGGDIGSSGDGFFVDLTAGNLVMIAIMNVTDANDATVEHISLRLKRVG